MNNKRRRKLTPLYIWHRYTGLVAALFVIFIGLSGIALNHTDDLALKNQYLSSNFLLERYKVQPPTTIKQFRAEQHVVTQADDLLFINNSRPIATEALLTGAVKLENFLLVALSDALLLVDDNDQVVETLSSLDGVPNQINRIGLNDQQQLYLFSNHQMYHLSTDLYLNKVNETVPVQWMQEEPLSITTERSMVQRYKSNIISLETFLLDIHSGRFFGSYGVLFFDVVGIILLFLAFSGLIIWVRQRR